MERNNTKRNFNIQTLKYQCDILKQGVLDYNRSEKRFIYKFTVFDSEENKVMQNTYSWLNNENKLYKWINENCKISKNIELGKKIYEHLNTKFDFETWYKDCFGACIEDAANLIFNGYCDVEKGSFFEISRTISKDGNTHRIDVEKENFIEYYGEEGFKNTFYPDDTDKNNTKKSRKR